MYLAQIAPAHRRDAPAGPFWLNMVIGILLACAGNFCVARLVGGTDPWRYKLAVEELAAAVFFHSAVHDPA